MRILIDFNLTPILETESFNKLFESNSFYSFQ